jgi:hypothetical protein
MFGGPHPPRHTLQEACRRAGLNPFVAHTEEVRPKRGRPLGRRDSRPRKEVLHERLEFHAQLMRDRYGAIEDYKKEIGWK